MSCWSLRHLAEAAVPRAGRPWGVSPTRYGAIREIADHARMATSLTMPRATDFCAALGMRFRQSLLSHASSNVCAANGPILYGNDLLPDEREIVLLHGIAHRLLTVRHRPVEFYAWLLTLELLVPSELLSYIGFDRFVEHHPHAPSWAVELVANLHEIRVPLRSEPCRLEDVGPDSSTSSRGTR